MAAELKDSTLFRGKSVLEKFDEATGLPLADLLQVAQAAKGPFTLIVIKELTAQQLADFCDDLPLSSATIIIAAARALLRSDNRDKAVYIGDNAHVVTNGDIRGGDMNVLGEKHTTYGGDTVIIDVAESAEVGSVAAGRNIAQDGSSPKIAASGSHVEVTIGKNGRATRIVTIG